MEASEGLWYYVQLSDGDVHRVTLDQLDDGFQAGHIDAKTMVLADGSTRWTTLGQLAGIDEPAPPARARSVSARPPPYVPIFPSHRPVSIDLSDLDMGVERPARSGRRWVAALAGLALVSAVGAVAWRQPSWARPYVSRANLRALTTRSTAAAPIPPPFVAPPPPIAPPPPVAPLGPVVAPPSELTTTPALAAASVRAGDSTGAAKPRRGAKAKAHKGAAATGNPHGTSPAKSRPAPFSTGGSKYDPLNSSI